jgi:hypothetical protein
MVLGELARAVMTAVLFGACYLVIALPFVLLVKILDPLRLRDHGEDTYWIELSERKLDRASFERMG